LPSAIASLPITLRCIIVLALGLLSAGFVTQIPGFSALSAALEGRVLHWSGGQADWSGIVLVDLNIERSEANRQSAPPPSNPSLRALMASVNTYLNAAGARATVYDVASFDPDPADEKFSASIEANAVFPAIGLALYPSATNPDRSALNALSIADPQQGVPPIRTWAEIALPSAPLVRQGKALAGVVNADPDEDGITRRIPLLHGAHGAVLPSMPLAAVIAGDRLRPQINFSGTRIGVGSRSWNANQQGEVEPKFPRNTAGMPVITFDRLVAGAGANDAVLKDAIRNRVVFIGNLNRDSSITVNTPAGGIPTVMLSAVGYTQLLSANLIQPANILIDVVLLMIALLPGIWLLTQKRGAAPQSVALAATAAIALAIGLGVVASLTDMRVSWVIATAAGTLNTILVWGWMMLAAAATRREEEREKVAQEESTRLKTQFLNHLTHELRTPLTAIMGFNKINQFTDELGKEQRVGNSGVIARNCEHLLALINNNLDLAKLEAGQLAITRLAEDPEPIFRDVMATMRAMAAEKKLDLRYVRRTPLPEALLLDSFRLRQVLLNLLGNAVKFTSRGSVEISVSWHIAALEIEVRDTGPGIPREALERIWQPFKQADLTIGRRFGGTGLGLAISRKLIELMNGEITVESQVGLGATFRVRVPSEATHRPASTEAVAPTITARTRLFGRVLLADDNEDLRNLVTLLLRNLGLEVHSVENGLIAVESAVSGEFDVVLMDMEMPVMNGYEAVHVLRARGYTGTILGLTAHQDGIEVARAILAGCDAVLTKPVSPDSLKQAITPVLERQVALRGATRREPVTQRQ
jgi:signal transduction histidine kinase/ActR/RegA family two-component response regulator